MVAHTSVVLRLSVIIAVEELLDIVGGDAIATGTFPAADSSCVPCSELSSVGIVFVCSECHCSHRKRAKEADCVENKELPECVQHGHEENIVACLTAACQEGQKARKVVEGQEGQTGGDRHTAEWTTAAEHGR